MTTEYTHPEYRANEKKWRRVRDAVAGEDVVKDAGRDYLPAPDEDASGWTADRYASYLRRAVYYNVTGRTLAGLVGVAFANWPAIETSEKYLLDDADGSGVGLVGQAQWMLAQVLQTGRGGLLADRTRLDPSVARRVRTVGDEHAAGVRSYVVPYAAEDILTWELDGTALSRLVLREQHATYEGGEVQYLPQLRELTLIEGKCHVEIWRKYRDKGDFVRADSWDTASPIIPFTFVGAVNNDACPDPAPLLDLATLNLAHYRNSADYEESAFLMGQPQLWVSGFDELQQRISFGSRTAIALPPGGECGLLQVSPNILAREAMVAKEAQMQTLGARLLSQGSATKTATQSAAETKAAYSMLSLACDNVSLAYTRAVQHAQKLVGGAQKASFAIDTRFSDLMLDANAIREVVAAWQAGLVPQSDAWAVLRRLGVIDQGKTDTQLAGEIEGQGVPLDLNEAA
ncbi:DUF4055 domain-containing protein [Lysobacter sp. HA35]